MAKKKKTTTSDHDSAGRTPASSVDTDAIEPTESTESTEPTDPGKASAGRYVVNVEWLCFGRHKLERGADHASIIAALSSQTETDRAKTLEHLHRSKQIVTETEFVYEKR